MVKAVSRRGTLGGLLIGAVAGLSAARAAVPDQVQEAYAAFNAAFNRGDVKALVAFYTEDALLLPANHAVITGPGNIEKFFNELLGTGVGGHQLELIQTNSEGGLVVAAASWKATLRERWIGGTVAHEFQRQPDGTLKLKIHIFN